MNPPQVAVIIPTYNRWPHICDAIESVLEQSYQPVQCLVVDDRSQDRTSEKLLAKYGDQIGLIAKKINEEKSSARNDGIRAAQADYVCTLDSDDVLTPDSIESRVRVFIDQPTFDGVVYGHVDRGDNLPLATFQNPKYNGDVLVQYLKEGFIHHNGILVSREKMLAYGMYHPRLTNKEDAEMLIRLMANLPFRYCGACVAQNRQLDRSARMNYGKIVAQDITFSSLLKRNAVVMKKIGGSHFRKIEFDENWDLADAHYELGNYRQVRTYCYMSLRRWPLWTVMDRGLIKRFAIALLKKRLS